jgi:hypothetical protein
MRTSKLLFAVLVSAIMMTVVVIRDAAAESAAVTNYKQLVTQKVGAWSARMDKLNDTLSKLKTQSTMSVPTTDPDAFAKNVKDQIAATQDTIRYETNSLLVTTATITVSPPDKSEAVPLPGFVKELIKSKGIPFAKNVSFAPDISWNFKSGNLGSASGTVTVTFP